MKEEIIDFLDKLIEEAELRHLPGDFKMRYIEQLRALVEERIGILALQELHQDHIKEFQELIKAESEEEQLKLGAFLREKIPEFDDKVQEVLGEFREQFLDSVR